MFPDFGEGSCINCGFLSVSQRVMPQGFFCNFEASPEVRTGSHPPGSWVRCFVHAANLPAEMEQVGVEGVPVEERLRQVLEKGRNCSRWYPWTPGFDPQWHYEGFRMRHLEEGRRRFEEQMEQRHREFEKGMENGRRKFDLALAAVVVIFAIAEVTATVISVVFD